ncbi:MAG: tetratricopeptide repeat protein [Oscillatoriales cyanobacterium]|nr:MAG: tetratricopeptide repeat protein [Oscillatoriales cyanobacterium]
MNFYNKIPIALIGTVATIVIAQPTAVFAISADEVGKIAKSITVLIDSKNPGSGIIIKRNGNTYTVLTARHVFKDAQAKYEIVTPDNKRYLLNYSSVKKLPNIDLAVVEFTSTQTYSVAKIGNSDLATEGKAAYVAGFPKTSAAINTSIYNFTDGRITANASRPLDDGYALVYSNNTLPGRADTRAAESSSINQNIQIAKTGFNLGIPINTSLRLLASSQVDLGVKVPSARVATGLKADDFYIQGVNRFYEANFQGAIAAYNQAIQLNPNYAAAYLNRGQARYLSRDTKGALEDLNQALRISPNNVEALFIRSFARKQLGDAQGATDDLNQVMRSNPISATDYTNRGSARSFSGDHRGAIEDFNQALKLAPNTLLTYIFRGGAYEGLRDYQSAIANYDQALLINPNFVLAYLRRGTARFELGDKQGAIKDYNEALKINPNNAPAYFNRGLARVQLGDKQGAIQDYTEALKIDPNNANAYKGRGIARFELGDKQGAIQDYNQALKINPNDAYAYIFRANFRNTLGDKQGAIQDYTEALKIDPNNADAYSSRGTARRDLGDNQGAITDLNEALRIDPNNDLAYYIRGTARSKLGDKQGAIQDYNEALRIDPNDLSAYFMRGEARRDLGDKEGAIQDFQKAADLFQQRGDQKTYQSLLVIIRQLQNNTPTQPTSTTLLSANSSLIPGKSSALPSDGSLYEQHTFVGRAGQSVTITLESSDFDTFVALFSGDGKKLAENDDISRSNTNSALTFTLPASGRYTVVVNAYKKGERGRYNLTIR